MKPFAFLIAVAVASCSPPHAAANPTAYFNPATGGIWIKNSNEFALGAVAIVSDPETSIAKNDPSLYATIPGVTFDPGDLPRGFAYIPFPSTGSAPLGIYIGDVIVPGTPISALIGVVYFGGTTSVFPRFPIIEIPEPSTLALAACGLAFLLHRRWASQSELASGS